MSPPDGSIRSQKLVCHSYYVAFGLIGLGILPPLIKSFEDTFGFGHGQMGTWLAVGTAVNAAASLVTGVWYDRSGPRIALTGALALCAVSALALFGVTGPVPFVVALTAFFFANGLGFSVNPLINELYGDDRQRGLNLLHAFQGVGRLGAPLLAVGCIAFTGSWKTAFLASAILSALWAVLFFWVLPAGPGTSERPPARRFHPRQVFVHLRNPSVLLGLVGMAAGAGCETVLVTWTPTLLESERGLAKAEALGALTAMMVGWTAVRFLLGGTRLGRGSRWPVVSVLTNAASLALLLSLRNPIAVWSAAVLLGASFGPFFPSMTARVFGVVSGGRGVMGGLLVIAASSGSMVMLMLVGWLGETLQSLSMAMMLAPLAAIGYAVCWYAMGHRPTAAASGSSGE